MKKLLAGSFKNKIFQKPYYKSKSLKKKLYVKTVLTLELLGFANRSILNYETLYLTQAVLVGKTLSSVFLVVIKNCKLCHIAEKSSKTRKRFF